MKKSVILASIIALFGFVSCSDNASMDSGSGSAQVNVRLTDAPANYDAVNIDIQKIEFTTSTGVTTVNVTNPGIYNLLNFKNGTDVLLSQSTLPAGTVSQMRLILGSNSTVVVNGVSYPLQTPSAQQSGLKMNWNETLTTDGSYNIWIDFDAARSIVKQGNGNYLLKPVTRVFSTLTDGQIKGYVLPQAAKAQVHVITATNDTIATALPNVADGYYNFRGLPAATYKVSFDADASTGYMDQTQSNVIVTYGQVTNLGTKTLTK